MEEKELLLAVRDLHVKFSLRGKELHALSRSRVISFVDSHDLEIYGVLGYSILHLESLYHHGAVAARDYSDIDAIFDDLGTNSITLEWIEEETGVPINLLTYFLSTYALIAAIALALCLIGLIFLANRKTLDHAFTASGLTCLILGGLCLLGGGAGLIFSMVTKSSLLSLVFKPLSLRLMLIGGVILVLGLLLLIAFKKLYNASARKKQASAGFPAMQPQ